MAVKYIFLKCICIFLAATSPFITHKQCSVVKVYNTSSIIPCSWWDTDSVIKVPILKYRYVRDESVI